MRKEAFRKLVFKYLFPNNLVSILRELQIIEYYAVFFIDYDRILKIVDSVDNKKLYVSMIFLFFRKERSTQKKLLTFNFREYVKGKYFQIDLF